MESGQDAGALASPARESKDGAPVSGAADELTADAAGDVVPGGGAGDDPGGDAAGDAAPGDPGGDEAAAGDGDGVAGGEPGGEARARSGAPVWAAGMAALAVVLIAGLVVSVIFLVHVRGSQAQSSRQQAAAAAARKAVADLTTASYQQPQQYVDRLRADATGSFLKLFTNSATGFKNVLQQGKVQTTGKVVDVGVQRVGTDTAQLSVLADVTVKNAQTPNGSARAYRLSVSMVSAGSHWLVSNVVFVQ